MSVTVAGCWELGWNAPLKELDLWEMVARDFEVAHLILAPVTGIQTAAVVEVPDLGLWLDVQRSLGIAPIFVDERGTTPLGAFAHPADACYVFGKVSMSALVAYGRVGEPSVRIETGIGLLWPHQAAAIVLYDRWRKGVAV